MRNVNPYPPSGQHGGGFGSGWGSPEFRMLLWLAMIADVIVLAVAFVADASWWLVVGLIALVGLVSLAMYLRRRSD